jgi:hypothetical protein
MSRLIPNPNVLSGSAPSIGNLVGEPVMYALYAAITSASGTKPAPAHANRRTTSSARRRCTAVTTTMYRPNGMPHNSASNGRLRKMAPKNRPPTTRSRARPVRVPRNSAHPASSPSDSVHR